MVSCGNHSCKRDHTQTEMRTGMETENGKSATFRNMKLDLAVGYINEYQMGTSPDRETATNKCICGDVHPRDQVSFGAHPLLPYYHIKRNMFNIVLIQYPIFMSEK